MHQREAKYLSEDLKRCRNVALTDYTADFHFCSTEHVLTVSSEAFWS